ncbi:MAG: acyltransferase family protein, partial [Flavobacteriales bacterium]
INSLRFFAAFLVVITHVEYCMRMLGMGSNLWLLTDRYFGFNGFTSIIEGGPAGKIHWLSPMVTFGGYIGVVFFFVLSGFLITYLLLLEKAETNGIQVRNFYMRRILRIWPIYLLMVLLGFFVFPRYSFTSIPLQDEYLKNEGLNLLSYILMVPNLSFAVFMEGVPNIGHLWSIGVEEQFYLIWPLLILLSRKVLRNLLWFCLILVLLKMGLWVFFNVISPEPDFNPDLMEFSLTKSISRFVSTLKFEIMGLGGVMAYLVFHKSEKILSLFKLKPVEFASYLAIPFIIYFTPKALYQSIHLLLALPFAIIIVNVATNGSALIRPENKIFDWLGTISYGIYVYHIVSIVITINTLRHFGFFGIIDSWFQRILIYLISISLTLLVSHLSFYYFEKYFIDLKRHFSLHKKNSSSL